MPHLVLPNSKYKNSFIEAVKEFKAEGLLAYEKISIDSLTKEFDSYVSKLQSEAQGLHLPEGYIAHTMWWLVEGDEFLGSVDIRHELTPQLRDLGGHIGYNISPSQRKKGYGSLILKLGLEKAKEMGLTEILVTCDLDNIGSKKIIEKNGGVLEDIRPQGEDKADKARYWIPIN